MKLIPRSLLAASALAAGLLPVAGVVAQDGGGAAPPPVAKDLYDQTDRKKTMQMKLPRSWKPMPSEDVENSKALAGFTGYFGEEKKSPNGFALFIPLNQFSRANLARAVDLPLVGAVKPDAAREGPGWTEGCAIADNAIWRRYVEKNGRVYVFEMQAGKDGWTELHAQIEKLLDTSVVTGEYSPPNLGDAFKAQKAGGFDVMTDAEPDREKSVTGLVGLFQDARDIVAKVLPGKPVDGSRPIAWAFQNGTRYDERSKAGNGGVEWKDPAFFSPRDRAALGGIVSEKGVGFTDAAYSAGAAQYVWQYFGGVAPIWISRGLERYGRHMAMLKTKSAPETLTKAKAAAAAGKRRLDQWFDVVKATDLDGENSAYELYAWQVYLRNGRGAKKYKKQLDAYELSLHDKGDPVEARKAFDGANFDEMLADFKAWAAEWK